MILPLSHETGSLPVSLRLHGHKLLNALSACHSLPCLLFHGTIRIRVKPTSVFFGEPGTSENGGAPLFPLDQRKGVPSKKDTPTARLEREDPNCSKFAIDFCGIRPSDGPSFTSGCPLRPLRSHPVPASQQGLTANQSTPRPHLGNKTALYIANFGFVWSLGRATPTHRHHALTKGNHPWKSWGPPEQSEANLRTTRSLRP